jgi:hypothetical protein
VQCSRELFDRIHQARRWVVDAFRKHDNAAAAQRIQIAPTAPMAQLGNVALYLNRLVAGKN